jgi:hypothetical protein
VTHGVYGKITSTAGSAVYGEATAGSGETAGVEGLSSSPDGKGVLGQATATTGTNSGVWGESSSTAGTGVGGSAIATSGETYGGRFTSYSPVGSGALGLAYATSGTNYGVWGQSSSTGGRGVFGSAVATSGYTFGGFFASSSPAGAGVYGWASATSGTNYGVSGHTNSTSGFGVYSSGNFAASGSKSCVVKTSKGPTLLYCQESPENWFEDVGEGVLADGHARIELDPMFLETVTIDAEHPMHVFVQLHDPECEGVAVKRGQTSFDVVELNAGTSGASFSYRVMAKRKGFEAKRLDVCEAARTDSYLYPELREKEQQEIEEEQTRMREMRQAVGNR